VDSAAGRTGTDEGRQYKGAAAAAAEDFEAAIGDRALSEGAAVGLRNKFNQRSAFGKGAGTNGMAASAIAHLILLLFFWGDSLGSGGSVKNVAGRKIPAPAVNEIDENQFTDFFWVRNKA
jgi:hypothetical protein